MRKDTPVLSRDVVLRPETLSEWAHMSFAKWTLSSLCDDDVAMIQEAAQAWVAVRQFVFRRDKGLCAYCGIKFRRLGRDVHLDHIIPRAQGGNDLPENLTVSCAPCNIRKADRTPKEWLDRKPAPKRPSKQKKRKSPGNRLLSVCPTCGARSGTRCLGRRGSPRKSVHAARAAKSRKMFRP